MTVPVHAAESRSRVAVVTVTYGDRGRFLDAVLTKLRGDPAQERIARVIVVNNAATDATRDVIERHASEEPRIHHLQLPTNLGSAGGFQQGLREALTAPVSWDLAWLLDDDNVPQDDALGRLVDSWTSNLDREDLAVSAARPQRPAHRRILAGWPVRHVYSRPSSFLGFHVLDVPGKIRMRVTGRRYLQIATREPVAIPFAPYGGLLIPRTLVERIGLPRADFFTYADDTEYTARIAASGGRLVLDLRSQVDDIDASWDQRTEGATLPQRLIQSPSESRIYLTVRNTAFVSRYRLRRSPFWFAINQLIFRILVLAVGLRARKIGRVRLLFQAMREGCAGDFSRFRGDLGGGRDGAP